MGIRKRKSNRRYPPRLCENPNCFIKKFIPHDSRQKYCNEQCRIDSNNDKRKLEEKPIKILSQQLKHNESILEKIFSKLDEFDHRVFSGELLFYEDFIHLESHDIEINITSGKKIKWFKNYGLEAIDEEKNAFTAHKREKY